MPHLITFQTNRFDPRAERENPINPIAGEAVLNWLREQLAPDFSLSAAEPEDWGWCCSVTTGETVYLVGASADLDQEPPIEWAVQIHKRRSLVDKMMGRNRHDSDDPLTQAIHSSIDSEKACQDVEIDTTAN